MSPFYHLVLPFDKFIVLDADIEFKSSPELLHSQFSKFMPGQVAGVGKDMSQLYRLYIYLDVEDNSDKLLEIMALIVSGLSVTECLQETNCLSNNK